MTPDGAAQTLKALLQRHIETWRPSAMRGDGWSYTRGILDSIRAITGEDWDDVLEEMEDWAKVEQGIRTQAVRRMQAGEDPIMVRHELNLSEQQWNSIRGTPKMAIPTRSDVEDPMP